MVFCQLDVAIKAVLAEKPIQSRFLRLCDTATIIGVPGVSCPA